jgi:hypothetical protein
MKYSTFYQMKHSSGLEANEAVLWTSGGWSTTADDA